MRREIGVEEGAAEGVEVGVIRCNEYLAKD
jgi:hypothetical protein